MAPSLLHSGLLVEDGHSMSPLKKQPSSCYLNFVTASEKKNVYPIIPAGVSTSQGNDLTLHKSSRCRKFEGKRSRHDLHTRAATGNSTSFTAETGSAVLKSFGNNAAATLACFQSANTR